MTPGLTEGNANVNSGSTVATLSTIGGEAPYTYSLNIDSTNGADNSKFVILGNKINVGSANLIAKNYKVSIKVIDGQNVSKIKNVVINVLAPEITKVTVTPVGGLKKPLVADTKVADLSTTGGIAPYTYSLKTTGDYASFKIDAETVKVKTQIDVEGAKNITVISTDKNGKTKEQTATINIAAA